MTETREEISARRDTTRRLLWRWGDAAFFCRKKLEEALLYKEMIEDAAGLHSPDEPGIGGRGPISDPTAATAMKIFRMQDSFRRMIDGLETDCRRETEFKRAMDEIIDALTPMQRKVIHLRYKDRRGRDRNSGWTYIARWIHYSEEGVRAIEQRAVDQVWKRIEIMKID